MPVPYVGRLEGDVTEGMLLDVGEQRIDRREIPMDVTNDDGIGTNPSNRSIRVGGKLFHNRELVAHATDLDDQRRVSAKPAKRMIV